VFGGNDRVYMTGHFDSNNNQLTGTLHVTYHAGEPIGILGWIDPDVTERLLITGQCQGDQIQFEGKMESNHKLRLYGQLTREVGGEIFVSQK
jgi:hypothetical protein